MIKTQETGVLAIACTKGLFIVKYLKNNKIITLSVHFPGRIVECINYVKGTKVILGIDS